VHETFIDLVLIHRHKIKRSLAFWKAVLTWQLYQPKCLQICTAIAPLLLAFNTLGDVPQIYTIFCVTLMSISNLMVLPVTEFSLRGSIIKKVDLLVPASSDQVLIYILMIFLQNYLLSETI
jgi:hypothetical protein